MARKFSNIPVDIAMQRFNTNYQPDHLKRIADKLARGYPCNKTGAQLMSDPDFFIQQLKDMSAAIIRGRITTRWTDEQIKLVNDQVIDYYNNQADNDRPRFYKKGRPMGAKNRIRPNSDQEAVDALKELSDDDDDSSDLDILDLEAMDYSTTPAPKIPTEKPIVSELTKAQIIELIREEYNAATSEAERRNSVLEQSLQKALEMGLTHVLEVAREEASKLKPNIIEIKRHDLPTLDLGVQHKAFETLLKMSAARLRNGSHNNIWIHGPAGTGKSTAAEMVAKALGLNYYTDGKMADETKVLGYMDANGTYRGTNFRQAFEFGGVYLADEIDGSMPDALLALNGALANGHCSFPDKIVSRHNDFIFLAAANTTGQGGTIEYVGRFKQDAAFNDRFVFLKWDLDEALEESLVANKEWLKYVRHVRARIASSTIKGHLITPRASIYGESLLAAGLDLDYVIDSVLRKGLTDVHWNMVR